MMRYLFKIYDGERHWVSAETREAALREVAAMGFDTVEEYLRDNEDVKVEQVPDDQVVKVYDDWPADECTPFTAKTAREWADEREGIVASTCV